MEQSILVLGQASSTVTNGRRLNILKDPKNAKPILKEKTRLDQKNDEKFRSHVEDTGQSKTRTLVVFTPPTSRKTI